MDASQCGNNRLGFGLHSVIQKLRAKKYKIVLGFKIKIVLFSTCLFFVQFISEFECRE
jgi:hypothetical protein